MIAVARGNKLYKTEHMNLPSRITARVPLVTPAATDFATWVHQNGSVLHEMSDGLRLWHDSSIGSGTNVSSRVRSLPGGSWDVQLACIKGFTFKRDISAGLVLRESATGKLLTFGFGHPNGGNIQWFQYNSPTSFQDNIRSAQERNVGAAHFFRARLVGANVEMLASPDGACWATFGTLALTTGFHERTGSVGILPGADQLGLPDGRSPSSTSFIGSSDMAGEGFKIDELDALPLPVLNTDRLVVGRSGDLKRMDVKDFRGGISNRKGDIVIPRAADFAIWVNQGATTIADLADGFRLERTSSLTGDNLSGVVTAHPWRRVEREDMLRPRLDAEELPDRRLMASRKRDRQDRHMGLWPSEQRRLRRSME